LRLPLSVAFFFLLYVTLLLSNHKKRCVKNGNKARQTLAKKTNTSPQKAKKALLRSFFSKKLMKQKHPFSPLNIGIPHIFKQ
jgi:hypothetical protein